MKSLSEKFLWGIKWNSIESCLYHGILWGYHLALFNTGDRLLYGSVGILFSLVYIGVAICTLGFDSALSPFIRQYTHSKTAFWSLLSMQCIPNILMYCVLLSLCLLYDANSLLSYFNIPPLDQALIVILVMLTIVESIKKTIKAFLGLLFYNRKLATLEITYISIYTTTVLLLYYSGHSVTLYTIFVPMLIYSTCITLLLLKTLYGTYQTLSDNASIDNAITYRIVRSRIFGYINQLGHLIFSGNVLVPLFAAQLGISYAAVAKIISTSISNITSLVNKIIGQPSEAALAHAHAYASDEKNTLFSRANKYAYFSIAYAVIGICIFNYNTLYSHAFSTTLHTHLIMLGFGILLCIEPFFMTYEKRYLIEEKGRYLSYYHLTMMALFGAWIYSNCAYPLASICALTATRLLWYYFLTSHSKDTYNHTDMSDCNSAS